MNEIGIVGPANVVVVDSSILQLATLSALGTSGTSLTVNNSQVWNQAIVAQNASSITLNSCNVTGSWFSTDGQSHITVNGGCFFENPTGCNENTMADISTGQPHCNPFIPAGYPNIETPATVALNGVNNNCTTGIADLNDNGQRLIMYPNPLSTEVKIILNEGINYSSLSVYNELGQEVKRLTNIVGPSIILTRGSLPAGVYFVRLASENNVLTTGKLVIADN